MNWFCWEKLKREWRTAAVAIVGLIVEVYDALVLTKVIDLPSLFPAPYQPYVGPGILVLMLLLRKWRDAP